MTRSSPCGQSSLEPQDLRTSGKNARRFLPPARPAGGVPLSEALPQRIWEDGSLPLLLALRAAAAWQAAWV